jgi:hypothetical protein
MSPVLTLTDGHLHRDETGTVWPGVTSILGGDGRGWDGVPPWAHRFDRIAPEVLEAKRVLGNAVHVATAEDDQGRLDLVQEEAIPYVKAWRTYRAESKFVPVHIECEVWHELFHYAGVLDRIGTVGKRTYLVDIKTGSEQDADLAGPQTAAYLEAARHLGLIGATVPVTRCSVHLRATGDYRVSIHANRRDWARFQAALELYTFCLERRR